MKKDALRVAEIQVSSWRKGYQDIIDERYLSSLDIQKKAEGWKTGIEINPHFIRLVISLKGKILGFAVGLENTDELQQAHAEVAAFYIDPDSWGNGLGKKLFKELKDQFQQKGWRVSFLWVLQENHRARSFYEKQGGILTNQKKFITLGGIDYPLVSYLFGK